MLKSYTDHTISSLVTSTGTPSFVAVTVYTSDVPALMLSAPATVILLNFSSAVSTAFTVISFVPVRVLSPKETDAVTVTV